MPEGITSIAEDEFESRLSLKVGKPVRHGFNADREGGDTFVLSDVSNLPVEPFSWDQLEEDATLLEDELSLSKEEIDQIVSDSYLSVVKYFHGVVDDSVLLNIFPGIDLNEPEKYNFKDAAIKTLVLPSDVYTEALNLNNDGASLYDGVTSLDDGKFLVNMTRKSLIVVRDPWAHMVDKAKRLGVKNIDLSDLNKYFLTSCVTHECIHKLESVPNVFTAGFSEGNIDLYAKMIIMKEYKDSGLASIITDELLPGYSFLMESAAIMHEILLAEGINMHDLQRIMLGYDRESEKLIENIIDGLGGKDLYGNLTRSFHISQEERVLLSRDLYVRKFHKGNAVTGVVRGLLNVFRPVLIRPKPLTAIRRLTSNL